MRTATFIFVILTIISGCASNSVTSIQATLTPVTIKTDATESVKVSRVIDGDTFEVLFGSGEMDRVRLLGIDTPETFSSNKADEYNGITDIECLDSWGEKATIFAQDILEDKEVKLIADDLSDRRGYYDRLLSYIEIDGKDFGVLLLEGGYARVYTEGKSTRKNQYILLEDQAKSKKLGLWACGT
ncbi:MAG: nuclease [SAR202 cluster bacterium]|nr:nuclease [SAR202 cluster bacterium]|tara:strand:- start:578 stop:1132 length:555 start_codon:yes stop_codon:yes gene_type:complete